jgi:MFS family permease
VSASFSNSFQLLKRYPAFARVFWADAAAQMGQNMLVVAFPTLILEVTHDITLTGLAFSGEILAYGLLSPWAGWVADRWEQKRLMITANGLRFVLLLLLLWTLAGGYPTWFYLLISLALGAAGALFSPARAAFLRRLLQGDDLLEAVALEGTSGFLIRLISPAVMGAILLLSDARGGVLVDASMYLVSTWLIAPAWVSGPRQNPPASAEEGDWRGGWRLLWHSAELRGLLWADLLISFLGMASWSTVVAYLEQVLQVRAANNGWLQASMGITGALGTRWVTRLPAGPWLRWGFLGLITLSYLGLAQADSLPKLVLVWSLRGLGVGGLVVLISQQMAREVPATHMGRVQAAWEQAVLVACFAGTMITPWLLRHGGPLLAFRLYGWAFLGFMLMGLAQSRRRR